MLGMSLGSMSSERVDQIGQKSSVPSAGIKHKDQTWLLEFSWQLQKE